MKRGESQMTWAKIGWMILICFLISLAAHTARGQNYENADSLNVVVYNDSLLQLYGQFVQENGASTAALSEPIDTQTLINYLFNIAIQANNTLVQADLLQMQSQRIQKATNRISQLLQAYTGKTYRQMSEERFIFNLAPCDTANVCQGFYTLRQTGQPNKILRIRSTGNVREVNTNGNQVAGGINGNLRFYAGVNRFSITVTAGPADLLNREIFLTQIDATANGRARWRSADRAFTLVQRVRLGDTGANVLNQK